MTWILHGHMIGCHPHFDSSGAFGCGGSALAFAFDFGAFGGSSEETPGPEGNDEKKGLGSMYWTTIPNLKIITIYNHQKQTATPQYVSSESQPLISRF